MSASQPRQTACGQCQRYGGARERASRAGHGELNVSMHTEQSSPVQSGSGGAAGTHPRGRPPGRGIEPKAASGGSLAKGMEAVLVKSGHPHMLTVSPCCVEQAQDPRAEPASSSGLPHPSHALGSGRVTEAKEQWRRVATGCQSVKPSDHPHQVGLHLATGISPNVGRMAAVIDDHATYRVGDMGSGRIEVRVATRDDGGAKGVTIRTGCNKQLHHVVWQSSGRGPTVSRAPPRTRKRRDGEADERLIWQQQLGDHVTLYSADAGIFPRRPPSGHGRVGSEAGRSWEASRPHLPLQQKAPLSLLSNRVGEGGTHPRVDACCSTDVVIRHIRTISRR